ncbi:MAG: putative membrane protein [Gammaproteobacteria bacterium]|jgi:uncharacterized membrane protein
MMMLIAGLLLFFAPHCISIFNEQWRDQLAAKIGSGPWKGLYSIVSLAGFALICIGYGMARQDPIVLYTAPTWMRHVMMLLMLLVFPLFLATNLPGKIKAKAKHPLLAATKIWAFAHLLVNGTLADVLLFGSFLAWAVLDRISMKKRIQRPIAGAPTTKYNDYAAVVVGLIIYAVFIMWGHRALIGVPVF